MDKCCQDISCLDNGHPDCWHLLINSIDTSPDNCFYHRYEILFFAFFICLSYRDTPPNYWEIKSTLSLAPKKNFRFKKFCVWKNVWSENNVWSEKNFGSKKFWWSKKNFGSEENFGSTNFFGSTYVSKIDFSMLNYYRFWWGSSCRYCSSCDIAYSDSYPPKLRQNPMSSLCVKFQPSSSPPSDRFWWGVLLLVLLLLLLVTGVKQSQLLV